MHERGPCLCLKQGASHRPTSQRVKRPGFNDQERPRRHLSSFFFSHRRVKNLAGRLSQAREESVWKLLTAGELVSWLVFHGRVKNLSFHSYSRVKRLHPRGGCCCLYHLSQTR